MLLVVCWGVSCFLLGLVSLFARLVGKQREHAKAKQEQTTENSQTHYMCIETQGDPTKYVAQNLYSYLRFREAFVYDLLGFVWFL